MQHAEDAQRRAAETIQRHWKTKNRNKNAERNANDNSTTKDKLMNTDVRWKDAAVHAQLKVRRIGICSLKD